jgi:hypothetical protein
LPWSLFSWRSLASPETIFSLALVKMTVESIAPRPSVLGSGRKPRDSHHVFFFGET